VTGLTDICRARLLITIPRLCYIGTWGGEGDSAIPGGSNGRLALQAPNAATGAQAWYYVPLIAEDRKEKQEKKAKNKTLAGVAD
jgi:hypothetical protein